MRSDLSRHRHEEVELELIPIGVRILEVAQLRDPSCGAAEHAHVLDRKYPASTVGPDLAGLRAAQIKVAIGSGWYHHWPGCHSANSFVSRSPQSAPEHWRW